MVKGTLSSIVLISSLTPRPSHAGDLLAPVAKYVTARTAEFKSIPSKRRSQLLEIAAYIKSRRNADTPVRLTFVCTHNSRRSQMAQVWAAVAAAYYGVEKVETYSGGTEGTAFNPRAVSALRRAGLDIDRRPSADLQSTANPRYFVNFTRDGRPLECFSKAYYERPNPSTDFCAVMVCARADEACPTVRGATKRISLPYVDPKVADDTADEARKYDQRSAQIAREMLFVFSHAAGGQQ